ncbi:hypothetical protein AX17_005452 [Amanita inopinata Kibby_2008]|nr:hypothetical protein AX17_005452 [Amanita inopinata Kibby_2008]
MDSVLSRLRSRSHLTLNDILDVGVLPSDLAGADVSVAVDGTFVETSSGSASREIKRHFDQLYGVGVSVRSPYAITAFVNQHGKHMYRVGNRGLSAPAAAAQEAESRISGAQAQTNSNDVSSSPPRSKRRSRMSMHNIFPPSMFGKASPSLAPAFIASPTSPTGTLSRPQTASSQSSGHRKLRKTRSFGPGDQPVYQQPQQEGQQHGYHQGNAIQPITGSTTFTGRAHSHSVTSADVSRFTSLASLVAASSSYGATSTVISTSANPSLDGTPGGQVPSPTLVPVSNPLSDGGNIIRAGFGNHSSDSLSQSLPQASLLLQQQHLSPNWPAVRQQPLPMGDIFAQVMLWDPKPLEQHSYTTISSSSKSTGLNTPTSHVSGSSGNSNSGYGRHFGETSRAQHGRTHIQHPFGAGVVYDSPLRRSPPPHVKANENDGNVSGGAPQETSQDAGRTPLTTGSTGNSKEDAKTLADCRVHRDLHALAPIKILREMQSFESTMTARQVDIGPSTARGTPVVATAEDMTLNQMDLQDEYNYNYRYDGLIDGDDADLRRPPSAIRLRNAADTTSGAEVSMTEIDVGAEPDSLGMQDSDSEGAEIEVDTETNSLPTTPIATVTNVASSATVSTMTSANQTLTAPMATTTTTTNDSLSALDHDLTIPTFDVESHLESHHTPYSAQSDVGDGSRADTPTDAIPKASCVPGLLAMSSQGVKSISTLKQVSSSTSLKVASTSRYASVSDVFDVLQTFTGLPLLDRLPTGSGRKKRRSEGMGFRQGSGAGVHGDGAIDGDVEDDDGDMMVETTVIRMSLATKDETAAPRDDPRFVIWGWVQDDEADLKLEGMQGGKRTEEKVKSLIGSVVSYSEDEDHDGAEDCDVEGKGSSRNRLSLGSKRRSKKKKEKEKGKTFVNEFGASISARDEGGGGTADESSKPGHHGDGSKAGTSTQALGRSKKLLVAATIERWVAQLTSDLNYDELLDFFLTYRTYISAMDLCRVLIGRFYWTLHGGDDSGREGERRIDKMSDERVRRIVRVRTFVAIRYWLLTFWTVDFVPNRELRLLMAKCLNDLMKNPLLQKHNDGLGIVKRLIKVAKECKQAHVGSLPAKSVNTSQNPSTSEPPLQEQQPTGSTTSSTTDGNDLEVDLDFLPDTEAAGRYAHNYGYGYGNRYGRASELLGPAGLVSPGLVTMPLSTLRLAMNGPGMPTSERNTGPGVSGKAGVLENQQNLDRPSRAHQRHQSQYHQHGALSRVVRAVGKLKRALNARSVSGSSAGITGSTVGSLSSHDPEVSAFELDMTIERDSMSMRGGVEGCSSFAERTGGLRDFGTENNKTSYVTTNAQPTSNSSHSLQDHSSPPVLPPLPLALSPLSVSGPASDEVQVSAQKGNPVDEPVLANSTVSNNGQLAKAAGIDASQVRVMSATTQKQAAAAESRPMATISSQGTAVNSDSSLEHKSAPQSDVPLQPATTQMIHSGTASISEFTPDDASDGAEKLAQTNKSSNVVQLDGEAEHEDTISEDDYTDLIADAETETSERTESAHSSSTDSFGVPLSTSRGPTPMFATGQSPWPFDIVSIDDLDLSDTSSDNHAAGPSAPPGLRKPIRKLPKKPLFWPRESVSSMGIISHDSLTSGPSSSGMSSPTAAGLGGKIEAWQLQDLLKSLSVDEEEQGGVDAALKRLEGFIDPQKQEEKIKTVNEWITSIQKRMETGDYTFDIDDPRFSYVGDDDGDVNKDEKIAQAESANDNEGTVTSAPGIAPLAGPTDQEIDSVSITDSVASSVASQPPHNTNPSALGSPPRALDAKPVPEDVVPLEILQSRMPPAASPPPAISTLNSSIQVPRLHQSFIVSYRAEALAQHFAMIDRELFMSIRFEELALADWSGCQEVNVLDWTQYLKDRARWKAEHRFPEKTSALAAVRGRFNLMTNFVISEVILTPPSARPLVFKKFLTIAYKSYTMNNFNALTAIITGLSSELVTRSLGRYWNRVGRREHRMFNDFRQLISNVDDFRYMRRVIDSIVDSKPLDDTSASVVSGGTDSKHKASSDQRPPLPSSCIPFIGVYLSQLHRHGKLPDFVDPTAPNLAVDIDPISGALGTPQYPDVFCALAPLPPFIQLEPLINVHKQRQIAAVTKSLVAGQHLASRIQFEIDKKLFQKCLRLRASDTETLQYVLTKYPD